MRAQGYEENQDYVLESRTADGSNERLPDLAAELVSLPVDVLVAAATPTTIAARNATSTIPIVMANFGADPVALGLVDSLARPGGNVTGLSNLNVALTEKRVELLKETLPALARIGVLQDLTNAGNVGNVAEAQTVARALEVRLRDQPEVRPGHRTHDPTVHPVAGDRGHPMSATGSAEIMAEGQLGPHLL